MKAKIAKGRQPSWISPMLATLHKKPFSDSDWIFEKKLDGIRCLVFSKDGKIKMMSRNKIALNTTYPHISNALEKNKNLNFIIDGEIVYERGKLNSFAMLQKLDKTKVKKTRLFVFDIIFLNGFDLTRLPLIKRKEILKKSFKFSQVLSFMTYRKTNGSAYFKQVVSQGFEGIIAKKKNSEYLSKRTREWLKIKSVNRQEFVICGFTSPEGSRKGFGALLLGFYKNNKLQYAGKVGTGFDDKELTSLYAKLKSIVVKSSPFEKEPNVKANWVRPKFIAECSFTEWTDENKLRHPSYLGLRKDVKLKNVRKE